ncbi:hypothetical protein MACH24_04980 [Erythrobacter sp. Dej080120_24]|uniref:DUF3768 domain-containing protein n=1 Tax=Erythrobacter sp. Dej080120_24 TaxID=3024837 RepID=UPI002925DEEA|nr:hypothetical protein MACH24_04980 [Erythrobacter sp. Dej080120_24]
MTADTLSRSERIARLNDRARQAMGLACVAVATVGFRSLSEEDKSRVRELVETFDAFTQDNDPYGERDFGAIYLDGEGRWTTTRPAQPAETVFWKIDAYDRDLQFGSDDPANPSVTRRVLTIMLASEY